MTQKASQGRHEVCKANAQENNTKEKEFVKHVIKKAGEDTGYVAMLRRGDNPDTEYYAWEALARFIDLQNDRERIPYALVGAAICRVKPQKDGEAGIGEALAKCCKDNRDEGNMRLRRLLSCDNIQEVCRILRQVLTLIQSRQPELLSYSRLLDDLYKFGKSSWRRNKVKQNWAMDFYAVSPPLTARKTKGA